MRLYENENRAQRPIDNFMEIDIMDLALKRVSAIEGV